MTGRRLRRRVWLKRLVGICALLVAPPALSALDPADLLERRVKAALLYRFINYVEWPDSVFAGAGAPFTIGIAGDDVLAAELAEFAAGRKVMNRPLAVRRRTANESFKDVQLLYIARDEATQLGALLKGVPAGALIVTDWPNALRQGAIINFLAVEGQVRFEISLESAQRRNIRLSSRLISVAQNVQGVAP